MTNTLTANNKLVPGLPDPDPRPDFKPTLTIQRFEAAVQKPCAVQTLLKYYLPQNSLRVAPGLKSYDDLVQVQCHTFGQLRRAFGDAKFENLLKLYFLNLNQLLGQERGLGEVQIDFISATIGVIYHAKILDLAYLCLGILRNKFGRLYKSLAVNDVLEWFELIQTERQAAAGDLSRRQHDAFKEPHFENPFKSRPSESLREMGQRLTRKENDLAAQEQALRHAKRNFVHIQNKLFTNLKQEHDSDSQAPS